MKDQSRHSLFSQHTLAIQSLYHHLQVKVCFTIMLMCLLIDVLFITITIVEALIIDHFDLECTQQPLSSNAILKVVFKRFYCLVFFIMRSNLAWDLMCC